MVDEQAAAVELEHRQQLAVAGLEGGIPGDVDLVEREPELLPQSLDRRPRPLAEVAARRRVERDAACGYG